MNPTDPRSTMSKPNPYAPPTAPVRDPALPADAGPAPALWNPNAAASWSLLFTPVFGAWLHMKNWESLGEPDNAAASWRWVQASAAILVAMVLLSVLVLDDRVGDLVGRVGGLALLLSWYYSSARAQASLVLGRYGKAYPRRAWGRPLLLALAGWVGFIVAIMVLAVVVAAVRGEL